MCEQEADVLILCHLERVVHALAEFASPMIGCIVRISALLRYVVLVFLFSD